MIERAGEFMQVSSGHAVWPIDPDEAEIDIEDIAHALSRQNRYGGHIVPESYSVAEHCWHLSYAVPRGYELAALLHDAAEAYLQDVINPIKPYLTNYREIEAGLEEVIFRKFGVPFPISDVVKEYDKRICADERDQVMAEPQIPWGQGLVPLGITIHAWRPDAAKGMFLARFRELYHG